MVLLRAADFGLKGLKSIRARRLFRGCLTDSFRWLFPAIYEAARWVENIWLDHCFCGLFSTARGENNGDDGQQKTEIPIHRSSSLWPS